MDCQLTSQSKLRNLVSPCWNALVIKASCGFPRYDDSLHYSHKF